MKIQFSRLSGMVMALFLGAFTSNMNAQQLTYYGSVNFSAGKYYFTETSQSLYLNNGVSVSYPNFYFSADLPYITQNTPWISYTSAGRIPTGGPQHGSVSQHGGKGQKGQGRRIELPDTASYTQSGFSDPTVSARYDVLTSYNGHSKWSVTGAAKIPFADPEMGFGTGKWDWSLGSSLLSRTQNWFWSLSAAYWNFGDMPDLKLNDALSYGLGIGRSFNAHKLMALYSIQGMTKVISGTDVPLSTGVGMSYKVGLNGTLSSNISVGLSDSTPDYSLGLGWMVNFN